MNLTKTQKTILRLVLRHGPSRCVMCHHRVTRKYSLAVGEEGTGFKTIRELDGPAARHAFALCDRLRTEHAVDYFKVRSEAVRAMREEMDRERGRRTEGYGEGREGARPGRGTGDPGEAEKPAGGRTGEDGGDDDGGRLGAGGREPPSGRREEQGSTHGPPLGGPEEEEGPAQGLQRE